MKISVITVNYNACQGLTRTIESVLGQQYDDFEYIVIDGGSNDGSARIIEQYSDNLAYWVSEKDSGIYNAMNKGVLHASGEYVIFMNSGDTFVSNDVLRAVSESLDADFVCGNALLGNGSLWTAPDKLDDGYLLNRASICHQSTFIRTDILRENPYNESFRIVADYCSLVYEMLVNHRSYRKLNEVICTYECDGVSSDDGKADREKIKVLDYLRYNGFIPDDELVQMCKNLKPMGRKYKIVDFCVRLLVKDYR